MTFHPTHAAILNALHDTAARRDAEGERNDTSPEYRRLCAEWSQRYEAAMTSCPTCGGSRTRREGARGYQCRDCTARDEYAHTGPY